MTRTEANAAQWRTAMSHLGDFVNNGALGGILRGGGTPISAFFSLGNVQPNQVTTANFSVMAFSDSQILGTGNSFAPP